jgi:prepilin-type N-terminal cleavage/methylation domain-containing protein
VVSGLGAPRRGFTLVESLVALLLLGLAALASASTECWTARALARAEAREDAATAAEALLDSLVAAGSGAGGVVEREGLQLEWSAESRNGMTYLRVRATSPGRPVRVDERFGTVWAPPPPSLDGS